MARPAADTVLIIEDDREIADLVALHLKDVGLAVERASDGAAGLRKAQEGGWALVILDIMLPRMDGFTVCSRLREKDPSVPIIMLTARSEEGDRVLGLEIGADEYVTKPFSVRELVARVKALLRRVRTEREARGSAAGAAGGADAAGGTRGAGPTGGAGMSKGTAGLGGLVLDFDKRKVTLDGGTVELTVKEFDLLALLVRHPGRAYSRTDLLNLVWGYQFEGYEHTVNSHINRLRAKIERDPSHPRYLKTVWGIGYRFAETTELEG